MSSVTLVLHCEITTENFKILFPQNSYFCMACEQAFNLSNTIGDGPLELGAAIARPLGLGIGLGIGIVPSYGAIAMG